MTLRGQPCPLTWLLLPAQRRPGSWNLGVPGMSGRSPSAFPAPEKDPSGAGGWIVTKGMRPRRTSVVAMWPKT
eukprot:13206420-Alexandrium_andersonii.AAC.1